MRAVVALLGGWRALAFALCALLALSWGGWLYIETLRLEARVALADAAVVAALAQRDAANAIAADYEARAKAAAERERETATRLAAEQKARASKWSRIRQTERGWAETEVPATVLEGLQ